MVIAGLDRLHDMFRGDAPADGWETVPEPGPEMDDTAELPVIRTAVPVSNASQAAEAIRHAWRASRRRARDEHDREGSWIHQRRVEQHSVEELCDYAQARPWVPLGHAGGAAEKIGVLYYAYARVRVTYHLMQAWKYSRLARWAIWRVAKTGFWLAILTLLGHGRLAAEIGAGVLLVIGAAAAAFLPRRSQVGEPEDAPAEEEDLS